MKSLRGLFKRNKQEEKPAWEWETIVVRRDSLEAQYLRSLPSAEEQWATWGLEPVPRYKDLNELQRWRVQRRRKQISVVMDELEKEQKALAGEGE